MTTILPQRPWQGRSDQDNPERAQRWHHRVDVAENNNQPAPATHTGLIGFCCDIGVKRNFGRPGAAAGPEALRKQLGNMAWHPADQNADHRRLWDFGNVQAEGDELEAAQQQLGIQVEQALPQVSRLLVVGGGHETAYGSFSGLHRALGAETRIGIINLDAHFDLRKPDTGAGSSGTPFFQIRELVGEENFAYFCLGVARESNTATLFDRAEAWGVKYRTDHQMGETALEQIRREIDDFSRTVDALYLTIDMDVLPHYQAPGVSAPASRGVSLSVIEQVIQQIITSAGQCRHGLPLVEITELNPACDLQGVTARTAAVLANRMLTELPV
ncbi:formimidoylglutamase [Endozoicomonadaceae bacterium StTr2]